MTQFQRVAMVMAAALIAGGALAACSSSPNASGTSTTTTKPRPSSTTSTTTSPAPSSTSAGSSSTTSTTTTVVNADTTTTYPRANQCPQVALRMVQGSSSGAAGTTETSFLITNLGPERCLLDGYPTIKLIPKSGSVSPVVSHSGQGSVFSIKPGVVWLQPSNNDTNPTAAVVIQYSDVQTDGQTSCPEITAVKITLPGFGANFTIPKQFSPCGAPNISVSAVVTKSQASLG